eukprot:1151253-Prymnesium_polylepis.1
MPWRSPGCTRALRIRHVAAVRNTPGVLPSTPSTHELAGHLPILFGRSRAAAACSAAAAVGHLAP